LYKTAICNANFTKYYLLSFKIYQFYNLQNIDSLSAEEIAGPKLEFASGPYWQILVPPRTMTNPYQIFKTAHKSSGTAHKYQY